MDYIGSKVKLNDWIYEKLASHIDPIGKVFVDACSGSGAVSRFMAGKGMKVISNDLLKFSQVLTNGSIGVSAADLEAARAHIMVMNSRPPYNGFFYKNYSPASEYQEPIRQRERIVKKVKGKDGNEREIVRIKSEIVGRTTKNRKFFTEDNAKKIDTCRQYIHTVEGDKVRDYLLYCCLEAISRVSNTAGVYGSFLKQFKDRAKEDFVVRPEAVYPGHLVGTYAKDIKALVNEPTLEMDVLYIDPPYNSRQYGNNYHIYEVFVRDDNPELHPGTAGLRKDWISESGSTFCSKAECLSFFQTIINRAPARWILISYNSDGLLMKNDFLELGAKCEERLYRRYKSDTEDANRTYNEKPLYEYLFVIQK